MSVLVVGVSHNSASVPLLEQVAPMAEAVPKLVQDVAACEHVTEATVIATCNRVEIYADVDRFHGSVEELSRLLVDRSGQTTESTGSPEMSQRAVQMASTLPWKRSTSV